MRLVFTKKASTNPQQSYIPSLTFRAQLTHLIFLHRISHVIRLLVLYVCTLHEFEIGVPFYSWVWIETPSTAHVSLDVIGFTLTLA